MNHRHDVAHGLIDMFFICTCPTNDVYDWYSIFSRKPILSLRSWCLICKCRPYRWNGHWHKIYFKKKQSNREQKTEYRKKRRLKLLTHINKLCTVIWCYRVSIREAMWDALHIKNCLDLSTLTFFRKRVGTERHRKITICTRPLWFLYCYKKDNKCFHCEINRVRTKVNIHVGNSGRSFQIEQNQAREKNVV